MANLFRWVFYIPLSLLFGSVLGQFLIYILAWIIGIPLIIFGIQKFICELSIFENNLCYLLTFTSIRDTVFIGTQPYFVALFSSLIIPKTKYKYLYLIPVFFVFFGSVISIFIYEPIELLFGKYPDGRWDYMLSQKVIIISLAFYSLYKSFSLKKEFYD